MEGTNENIQAHSVLRLVIPTKMAGTLIGKGGSNVRTISEETGAKLKILELPQGTQERVLMVSALEEENSELSAAREAMLRIHDQLIAADELAGATTFNSKLLMPNGQTGTLIGKGGEMIRSIQEESGATIRITEVVEAPPCALPDDRMVEISSGSQEAVKSAVRSVLDRLRKFAVDRSVLQHFDSMKANGGMVMGGGGQPQHPGMGQQQQQQPPMYHMDPQQQQQQQMYQQGMAYGGGGGMGGNHQMYGGGQAGGQPVMMQQPRQYEVAGQQMVMMAPSQGGQWMQQGGSQQSHQAGGAAMMSQQGGGAGAGGAVQGGGGGSGGPAPAVSLQMRVPRSQIAGVLGQNNANLNQIRSMSGATVTVHDSNGPEHVVEISGSSSQVQAAQALTTAFMLSPGTASQAAAQPQAVTQSATGYYTVDSSQEAAYGSGGQYQTYAVMAPTGGQGGGGTGNYGYYTTM